MRRRGREGKERRGGKKGWKEGEEGKGRRRGEEKNVYNGKLHNKHPKCIFCTKHQTSPPPHTHAHTETTSYLTVHRVECRFLAGGEPLLFLLSQLGEEGVAGGVGSIPPTWVGDKGLIWFGSGFFFFRKLL